MQHSKYTTQEKHFVYEKWTSINANAFLYIYSENLENPILISEVVRKN